MVESANDPLGEVLQYVADEADPVFGASGYLVIGALARDVILGRAADGWRLRSTSDVDLSIGVRDAGEFWTALDRLGEPRGIAIRRGLGRLPVDILPFGGVGTAGIFEHDGKQFDIRGLEDAFKASAACPLPGGRFVRVPTLASMLGLKVIAWGVRHQNTAKDARDLGALLDVTRDDPYSAPIWEEGSGAQVFEYDPVLAGPFVYGAKLRQEFGSRSLGRVMEILDPAARHRELLAAQAVDPLHGAEHRGMLADRRLEQIEAFRQGCGGLIPDVGTD